MVGLHSINDFPYKNISTTDLKLLVVGWHPVESLLLTHTRCGVVNRALTDTWRDENVVLESSIGTRRREWWCKTSLESLDDPKKRRHTWPFRQEKDTGAGAHRILPPRVRICCQQSIMSFNIYSCCLSGT